MSEIPEDIMKAAWKAWNDAPVECDETTIVSYIANSIRSERNRCLSILKSIEPINPSEAHLIETIVRRIRGSV